MEDGEIRAGQGQPLGNAKAKSSFNLEAELGSGQEACAEPSEEVLRGRIVTGMPLSQEQQQRVARRFEELLGRRVTLSCHVDAKQLAGIRVELNGYSYDGTLRGQLTALHKMLTRPDEEVR
ncbi:MAG: F0F1 ATP synthase subunit delta [Candidatus Limiplasma sp.]|nr:F0F1 ATP synthase subunit delta [Candidatus Limiplasma sp.]